MLPSRSHSVAVVVWLSLLAVLAACRPDATRSPFDPADPEASAAALRKHLAKHPDDVKARRDLAHIEWIWLGQDESALSHMDMLVSKYDPAALLSRLIMAKARYDLDVVAATSHDLLALAMNPTSDKGSDDPFLLAAAEVAARTIQQIHGERPGDDARFVKAFDANESELGRLPFSVRQPLLSLRASIARRQDESYKQYFAAQGCVQTWEASAVWGRLGDYELEAQGDRAFEKDPSAVLVPLSCVVRVWNPTDRSGIRKLRTTLRTQSDTIVLDVSAEESLRLWLDGKPIHRTDRTDRYSARRHRIAVPVEPGAHVLELATTISGDKSWLLVRAADGNGTPLEAVADGTSSGAGLRGDMRLRRPPWPEPTSEQGPFRGPLYAPLRAYLATDAALADGDTDVAERRVAALDAADRFAEGWLMRASFERNDRSRPATNSASREQKALEEALALVPNLEGANTPLLELMLRRGDDTEATAMLEALPKGSLRTLGGELLRYQVHRSRGKEHLANAALARAKKLDPDNCRVLRFERAEARDLSDVRSEDELTAALSDCAGSLSTRAQLAETRGRWQEAEALWKKALERKPDDLDAMGALARMATLQDEPQRAVKLLEQAKALAPLQVGPYLALADLALASGKPDQARAEIQGALDAVPFADILHATASDLGGVDDLLAYRVDGLAKLKEYQASGATYEGVAEALVLDRSVARVYEGGGMRQIVHIMAHLLSKEALDRYGEMQTPAGARLLTLRSIKPDGQIFEPELVPGKEGVSLRHLAVGDFVEYEYVMEQAPSGVVPGYVDVSTFRFQSFDVPYHRSELLVLHPPELDLQFDRRNTPPQMQTKTVEHGGRTLTLRSFGVDEMPRLGVEPGARAVLEEVPNVRIYTTVDTEAWLRSLAASIYYARRTNPQLRALVRKLVRGKEHDEDKLHALWTWVVENVEDGGDLSSAATATFATRRGNRLALLATLLDQAGIEAELWLARNRHGPKPLPGGHPMIENYDAAMLSVKLAGRDEPLMVMTASKVMPLGYLPPGYDGTHAVKIPVRPSDEAGIVDVPVPAPELADKRRWDLDIDVDVLGDATVKGTITLHGGEAIAWRQALRQLDEDRVRDVFQQAELGWLRGSELVDLSIEGADALAQPLEIRFEATTAAMGVVQNGALVLQATPVPMNLGSRYVALPRRVTGMVVPYSPVHEAVMRVHLRDGRFAEVPEATTIRSDFGAFERTVDGAAGASEVELRYSSTLRTGVVEADAYSKFSGFAREVESATQASLRAVAR